MPGDNNQSDPSLPHNVPAQTTSGTAGEFTQIFAAGAASKPLSASGERPAFASPDDDFAKLFLAPSPGAGTPPGRLAGSADNEATLIFEAMPAMPAQARTVPAVGPAALPERTTATPPLVVPRASESTASEFTQIFSPLAPPAAPPPELKPPGKPPAPPSGEFTQFFSAISARESSSAPRVVPPAPRAQVMTPAPAAVSKPADDFDRMFPQEKSRAVEPDPQRSRQLPPTQPPLPVGSQASTSGDFTQIFQQPFSSLEPSRKVAPAAAVPPPAASGESFTQIFQQIAPPQARPDAAAILPQVPAGPVQAAPSAQFAAPAAFPSSDQWPAFGPPPQPSGTFTDVFAAQPSASGTSWPAGQPAAAPTSQGGGFTELFQAMPAAAPVQPAASQSPSSAPSVQGASGGPWFGSPQASAPQAAPLAAGSGDFTRLMQSLTPSAQESAPPPQQNDAFFASSPSMGSSAHQESEYTRVQRASSLRDAGGAPPAPAAPMPGAAVAPGLAMGPSKEKPAEKEAPAKKSKTLIILLVAMNILLLLALIVIAFLVLRRK